MILAIDPGKRACGAAVFYPTGQLRQAAYVRPAYDAACAGPLGWVETASAVSVWARPFGVTKVLIERQVIYPESSQQKGDLNDLLDVAGVAGALAFAFIGVPLRDFFPAQWKGQVPKAKMTKRILEHLTPGERASIQSVGAKDHNTIDAVGIGLYHFGRLHKQRIFR